MRIWGAWPVSALFVVKETRNSWRRVLAGAKEEIGRSKGLGVGRASQVASRHAHDQQRSSAAALPCTLGDFEATVLIDTATTLDGYLPPRASTWLENGRSYIKRNYSMTGGCADAMYAAVAGQQNVGHLQTSPANGYP